MAIAPILLNSVVPLGVAYGASGGPRFATGVVNTDAGFETRAQRWADGLIRAELGQRRMTAAEWDALRNFFRSRRGRYEAFLYRDWSDDRVVAGAIGTGNGATTAFQLVKHYGLPGSYDPVRTIEWPLPPWNVYLNGVKQLSGYTIGASTGVLTFSAAPTNGVAITADFFFAVPVRFDADELDATLVAAAGADTSLTGERFYDVGAVPVVEVRE